MANKGVMLHVDTSDLAGLIERTREAHTEKEFKVLMRRAFQRTGGGVRRILREEIPHDYQAPTGWVSKQVGGPNISVGAEVSCTIPVDGKRGFIGAGGVYKAAASHAEGMKVTKARRKGGSRRQYKVNAQIVTAGASGLPGTAGSPPVHFMVFSGPKRGRVYARLDRSGKKTRPAVGIGVPQMPTNRSEEAVQMGIMELLGKRIEHEHAYLIGKYAR